MERPRNKIAIIGAGPGGLVTALFLAKKNIHTVVLDKDVFPRLKPCGDNITGDALRIINELDDTWLKQICADGVALPIDGVTVYSPDHNHLDIDFLPLYKDTLHHSCFAVPRNSFDGFLFERAKENSLIELIEDCCITKIERMPDGHLQISDRKGELILETEMLVVAAGSNSDIAGHLLNLNKPPQDVAVGVRAYFEGVVPFKKPNFCEVFITKELLPGGLYITPFADGTVNVNVVMRSDVVRKRNLNLSSLMMEMLQQHPVLSSRFANARMITKPQGSSLFLGTRKRKLSGDNFLLVGDSAGLIDLLSANGIPQTLLSAKFAAEEIEKCLGAGNFSSKALAAYDERVFRRIEGYLKMSGLLAPIWTNRLFLAISVAFLNHITRRFSRNDELRDLMYEKNIVRRLIKPSFYYRLIIGIKNSGSMRDS